MKFLRLLPDAAGYSHQPSGEVASRIPVEGGFDVRRTDLFGLTTLFQLTFTVGPDDFAYLNDFVDEYFEEPDWFHMLLIGFPRNAFKPLQRYAIQILPGSYKTTKVDGHRYVAVMTVEGYLDDPIPTSEMYPYLWNEGLTQSIDWVSGSFNQGLWIESLDVPSIDWISGALVVVFTGTYNIPPEGINTQVEWIDGLLKVVLLEYSDGESEGIESFSVEWLSGLLKVVLIEYDLGEPEGIDSYSIEWISGTLS